MSNDYYKLMGGKQQGGVLVSAKGEFANHIRALGINSTGLDWGNWIQIYKSGRNITVLLAN